MYGAERATVALATAVGAVDGRLILEDIGSVGAHGCGTVVFAGS